MIKYSVVIPVYNEEATIREVIYDLIACLFKPEIIIVNDCSTDSTPQILSDIAKSYPIRVITNEVNEGHAKSVIKGLMQARNPYIIYMDGDNQIPVQNVLSLDEGYDLLSAYRVNRQDKTFRKVISLILRLVILFSHGDYIRDANCPFKVFKKEALMNTIRYLPKDCQLPSVDLEILFRRFGLKTKQFPVIHMPYVKVRKGMLQSLNKKSMICFINSFWEVVRL